MKVDIEIRCPKCGQTVSFSGGNAAVVASAAAHWEAHHPCEQVTG